MRVWHRDALLANGPTFSSILGIVKLNGVPSCAVKPMSIVAGSVLMRLQAIPYVPASAGFGLMSGEIRAYIAFDKKNMKNQFPCI